MSESDDRSASLETLRAQFEEALLEQDSAKRLRLLLDLTEDATDLELQINESLKKHQKSESFLEVEKRFVTKHETKLDALAKGFFNCYVTPGKARAALDQLCDAYDTQYVLNAVALGVKRLSKPLGMELFGIKSEARMIAEAFYEKNLRPALEKVIPDHGDYLKLKRLDVEERFSKVLQDIESCRKASVAIEADLKKYRDRFAAEAKSISDEDVNRLPVPVAVARFKILPPNMRESAFEAHTETLASKPHSLR